MSIKFEKKSQSLLLELKNSLYINGVGIKHYCMYGKNLGYDIDPSSKECELCSDEDFNVCADKNELILKIKDLIEYHKLQYNYLLHYLNTDENTLKYKSRQEISKKLRFEIFKRDNFKCTYCGTGPKDTILEIDHIKPFSKGGKCNKDNYTTACYECNIGKGNTILDKSRAK